MPEKSRPFAASSNSGTAGVNEVRDAALYNFNMLFYQDPEFTNEATRLFGELGPEAPKEINRRGLKPDLAGRRGAIRSVFDGRHKFSRYFSTLQHNKPQTFEDLLSINDIELFDHESDPTESDNLATDTTGNRDLIMAMNGKLNAIIEEEVGIDDGTSLGLKAETEYGFSKVDI